MKKSLLSALLILSMSGSVFAESSFHSMPILPTPATTPAAPDPMLPMDKIQGQRELTPTSLDLDLTDLPLNLAGTQMEIVPLEETMLVNNLDTTEFTQNTVGAIAINDSADHYVAVSEFTPIGAAAQIEDDELENQKFDFVIQSAIFE